MAIPCTVVGRAVAAVVPVNARGAPVRRRSITTKEDWAVAEVGQDNIHMRQVSIRGERMRLRGTVVIVMPLLCSQKSTRGVVLERSAELSFGTVSISTDCLTVS